MAVNKEIIDVSVRGARKAQSSLKGIGSTVLKMGGAFFAAKGIVTGLKTIISQSSQLKSVEQAFNNMGTQIGFSEGSLKKLQDATDGTVSKLELMTKANNAMALGIVGSDEEMAKLFDTAQRLGKALGQDTVSALDSLVSGMGRQSKLMLDNLGIMVDTQGAYDDYAKSIGKTSKELTDAEKKIAFNNAAMAEATRIADSMGKEQLSVSDKLAKLKNTFVDLAGAIGTEGESMFGSVLDMTQNVADKFTSAFEFATKVDWAATWTTIKDNSQVIFDAWGELLSLAMDFIPDLIRPALAKAWEVLTGFFDKLVEAVVFVGQDLWKPIGGHLKVLVHDMKGMWTVFSQSTGDTFEMMGAKIKNGFTIVVNGIKANLNTVIKASNTLLGTEFKQFEMGELIDTEGMADKMETDLIDTRARLNEQRQEMVDEIESSEIIDMIKGMFVPDEDDIDTFSDFSEKYTEIWQKVTDKLVIMEEDKVDKTLDANGKIIKNQKDISKKSINIAKTTATDMNKAWAGMASAFAGLNEALGGNAILTARIEQGVAIVNTYAGATNDLKENKAPLKYILAATTIMTGLAQVAQIQKQIGEIKSAKSSKAQFGANYITAGPEMLMVGDNVGGRERVSVEPIGSPSNAPNELGSTINLAIEGNVMTADFTEDYLVPQLKEALRLGGEID